MDSWPISGESRVTRDWFRSILVTRDFSLVTEDSCQIGKSRSIPLKEKLLSFKESWPPCHPQCPLTIQSSDAVPINVRSAETVPPTSSAAREGFSVLKGSSTK